MWILYYLVQWPTMQRIWVVNKRGKGENKEMPFFPLSLAILWQHSSTCRKQFVSTQIKLGGKWPRELNCILKGYVKMWELLSLWMLEALTEEDTKFSNWKRWKSCDRNFVWEDFFGPNLKLLLKIRKPSCASELWNG